MRASESLWVGIRSLVKIPGKATYSKHDSTLFLSFFEFRFLFIAPDALDVISSIGVVGFVVGDVELAHDGKRLRCVVCLSLRPGAFSLDSPETRYFNQQETPACDVMRHERIQSVKLTSVILRISVLEEDSRVSLIPVAYHGVEDEFTIAHGLQDYVFGNTMPIFCVVQNTRSTSATHANGSESKIYPTSFWKAR